VSVKTIRQSLPITLLGLCSLAAAGHTSGERATGVVEQPCAAYDPQHDDWAGLCHYQAENSTVHHAGPVRVVFLGDSITENWKTTHPDFFTDGYVDRGVSGQTTAQMLVRFRQDVIALKPQVVHILGGTYDFAGNGGPTSVGALRNNIISMVELAEANDIRVVLGSVPPAGAFPWRPAVSDPAPQIVEFNHWLRRFAHERGLVYVDYHEVLADERDAMKQTFAADGVHPNSEAYAVMEPLARHAIQQAMALGETAKPGAAAPGNHTHSKDVTGKD
jgi:lysophospholipase L1-like esterase